MATVYELIKKNPAVSSAELAKRLETSERQGRKAIDELRDKKIRRKGGDSGEREIKYRGWQRRFTLNAITIHQELEI